MDDSVEINCKFREFLWGRRFAEALVEALR